MAQKITKPEPINIYGVREFVAEARKILPTNRWQKTPALDTMEEMYQILMYLRELSKKALHDDFDTTPTDVVKELLRLTMVQIGEQT